MWCIWPVKRRHGQQASIWFLMEDIQLGNRALTGSWTSPLAGAREMCAGNPGQAPDGGVKRVAPSPKGVCKSAAPHNFDDSSPMARAGIEPATPAFSVQCSTN